MMMKKKSMMMKKKKTMIMKKKMMKIVTINMIFLKHLKIKALLMMLIIFLESLIFLIASLKMYLLNVSNNGKR